MFESDKYYHVVGWGAHGWTHRNPKILLDILTTGLQLNRTLFGCIYVKEGGPVEYTNWQDTAVLEIDIDGLPTKERHSFIESTEIYADVPPERIRVVYMPEDWVIAETI